MKKLSKRQIYRFCMADIAKGLFNGLIGNYLIYFFQPTVKSGIPNLLPENKLLGYITVMSVITALSKIVDAVTDPLVANLSDKSTNPEGRRMPFMKKAGLPYALSVFLIFMAPFHPGSILNALWVALFFILYYVAYTFYFIPRNALVPEVIPDAADRVSFYGISAALFMGSSAFMYAATLFVNLLKSVGFAPIWAWRTVFGVFTLIGGLCVMLTATAFREKDYVTGTKVPKDSMEKTAVNSLIACVDVYVSTHRAEGFGLVMAEAMLLKTACIATNWSSNTEFMDSETACMVSYTMVQIGKGEGSYPAGATWADPDMQETARYMKLLKESPDYYREMVERAFDSVSEILGKDRVETLLTQRISQIYESLAKK